MMKYIFGGLIVFSVIFGIVSGNISDVSTAALSRCSSAVELCISLAGVMCLWSGVMRVAENSGVTKGLAKALSPILSRIFKGISKSGKAFGLITMNVIANLLGLGNAATPLGIAAMKALEEEEHISDTASTNMIMLVVINTASIQLVPTTIAALRLSAGSASPFEIIVPVLCTSALSVTVGIMMVKILDRKRGKQS
ncbi:MAG: nucleoside recognition domain-containing protein [Oscillospiraceae bacterium]